MVGTVILCTFAVIVWIIGIWASGHGALLLYAFPVVVSAAIVAAARRQVWPERSPEARKRVGRVVGFASGFEGLAIFVAFLFVPQMQMVSVALPVVAIIVGLHFLPLAHWFPAPIYYATGACLIALGATAFAIPGPDARILCVGIALPSIYWLTCIATSVIPSLSRDSHQAR